MLMEAANVAQNLGQGAELAGKYPAAGARLQGSIRAAYAQAPD